MTARGVPPTPYRPRCSSGGRGSCTMSRSSARSGTKSSGGSTVRCQVWCQVWCGDPVWCQVWGGDWGPLSSPRSGGSRCPVPGPVGVGPPVQSQALWYRDPPVDRQTENITFPHTPCVGGKTLGVAQLRLKLQWHVFSLQLTNLYIT